MEEQGETHNQTAAGEVNILTYHFAINYGAVLQAYSLKSIVSELGYKVRVLDYATNDARKSYRIFRKYYNSFLKNVVSNILVLPNYKRLADRIRKFAEFREEYLDLTERCSSENKLLEYLERGGVVISGSDQVFNVLSSEPSVYYLPFNIKGLKKVAYAPSFGFSNFTDEIDDIIRPSLKQFDCLSCRESSGSEHIKQLTGKECPLVLDPVLLHKEDFWSTNCIEPKESEDYILIYDLLGGTHLVDIAKRIKALNPALRIICLTTKKFLRRPYNVDEIIWDAGPREFVGYIKNARYVVTDSFHGAAFSVIFRKKFVSLIISERASDRLETLLTHISSQHKLLTIDKLQDNIEIKGFIIEDYHLDELENKRKQSLCHLEEALKSCCQY